MIVHRPSIDHVYLCTEFVDFRKQMSGLSIYVEAVLNMNPFDPNLFIFCNKRRSHIKALYWDANGFAMWQKSLAKDKFKWPKRCADSTITVTNEELQWLLDGLDFLKIKPHKTLEYSTVF